MIAQMTNWAEIYRSLQINTLRTAGIWMLLTILIAGILIIFFSALVFGEQSVITYSISVILFMVFLYYQLSLIRLYKNPKVYTGNIYDKFEKRHFNDFNGTETVRFFVRMQVDYSFKFNKNGTVQNKNDLSLRILLNCPSHLFEKLTTGNEVSLVIMPHNNTITRII